MSDNPHTTSVTSSSRASGTSAGQTFCGLHRSQWLVIAGAVVVSVLLRMVDTPLTNFSSLVALSLLCGSVVRHPAALLLPLLVRLVTDVLVHLNTGYGFFPSWPFDYTAYLLIVLIGRAIPARNRVRRYGGTVAAIAVYFALSNFGVWLLWTETYPRTISGLTECYYMALPFARGTIIGNLIAAPLFFGFWNAVTATASNTIADNNTAAPEQS